jgi:type IV secretory pathway component VirB8
MFRLSLVIFSEYFNTKEFLTCRNISTSPVHNKYLKYYTDKNITEYHVYIKVKDKGKAIPVQAWRGPEGSRRLRLPDFMTIGT